MANDALSQRVTSRFPKLSDTGETSRQLLRYVGVGLVVTGVDFVVFLAGVMAAPRLVLLANVVAKLASGVLGFLLHRQFTFSWNHRDGALT